MKRIELQPAKLHIEVDRRPRSLQNEFSRDVVECRIFREEFCVEAFRVQRGALPDFVIREKLSASEQAQLNAALVAEWLDWKPSDIGDSMASETILDVFARLKKSLEDKGLVAGGEAAE